MEDNNTTIAPRSIISAAARYSLIMSIASIIYYLILYVLKLHHNPAAGWVSLLVTAVIMFFCIQNYRDKELGGFITFGKAFSVGLLTAFFSSFIYVIFFLLFITFIDTTYVTDSLQIAEQQMVQKQMSQEQIDMALSMTKKFMTPLVLALSVILFNAFFGLIVALVEALILKKDNPEMPQI